MKGSILIVDDVPENIQILAEVLTQQGYEVRPTNSGSRALKAASNNPPDLILLDIHMPEMNGYEVCEQLKVDEKLRHIPVIFISALGETFNKVQAFDVGGVDYITKPFQIPEVLSRVQTHLELYWRREEIATLREWETTYLEQMNQLKDDVLGIVSHDLKNPLGIIMGNVQLLEYEIDDAGVEINNAKLHLDKIMKAAHRMNNLIRDLLDLARTEGRIEMRMKEVSLVEFLRTNIDDYSLAAQEKNITLVFTPPQEDILITISPDRFSQVVQNILSNAVKYTRDGGRVELAASYTPDEFTIAVHDNGIGIPQRDIPRLFDKFYRVDQRAHRAQSGAGLGMAIVKSIVDQHQGKISVESVEGVGSTFIVTVPRVS